ncbi:MAG: DUF4417 domain-containing protein [Clostridia bacterium]
MTEENYKYRTSPFLLRNQFDGDGKFEIPMIPKAEFTDDAFKNLLLIGFDRTNLENNNHLDRMVHFFLYDYKFERVWKNPDNDIEKLRRYKAVLSPDFSMYREMNPVMQLYNTFRNRWCGAYFASKGIRVIPTVSWGDENTFDFCFSGIPKGSTVAVSTYMVSEHNNHSDQKEFFLKGYHEMLRRIEPERIICYNEPFPEMQGNIIFVDYELSSWKYQNDDYRPSKYVDYILGKTSLPSDSPILIKSGYVMRDEILFKGMGSAFGGEWQPKSEDDNQLVGKPGETKTSGYKETKIGEDGRANYQQHNTSHSNPNVHSNPHGHNITWGPNGNPQFGPAINDFGEKSFNYYNKGVLNMEWTHEYLYSIATKETLEENRFKTISDFKWCMKSGGEVGFAYNDKMFGIWSKVQKTPNAPLQLLISQICIENLVSTEMWYDTADEALEYIIDGVRLRDIITEIEVFDRTI